AVRMTLKRDGGDRSHMLDIPVLTFETVELEAKIGPRAFKQCRQIEEKQDRANPGFVCINAIIQFVEGLTDFLAQLLPVQCIKSCPSNDFHEYFIPQFPLEVTLRD